MPILEYLLPKEKERRLGQTGRERAVPRRMSRITTFPGLQFSMNLALNTDQMTSTVKRSYILRQRNEEFGIIITRIPWISSIVVPQKFESSWKIYISPDLV